MIIFIICLILPLGVFGYHSYIPEYAINRNTAENGCKSAFRTSLATINNEDENTQVKKLCTGPCWIGAIVDQTKGEFVWSSNNLLLSYNNFVTGINPRNSSENCTEMLINSLWNDLKCTHTRSSVVVCDENCSLVENASTIIVVAIIFFLCDVIWMFVLFRKHYKKNGSAQEIEHNYIWCRCWSVFIIILNNLNWSLVWTLAALLSNVCVIGVSVFLPNLELFTGHGLLILLTIKSQITIMLLLAMYTNNSWGKDVKEPLIEENTTLTVVCDESTLQPLRTFPSNQSTSFSTPVPEIKLLVSTPEHRSQTSDLELVLKKMHEMENRLIELQKISNESREEINEKHKDLQKKLDLFHSPDEISKFLSNTISGNTRTPSMLLKKTISTRTTGLLTRNSTYTNSTFNETANIGSSSVLTQITSDTGININQQISDDILETANEIRHQLTSIPSENEDDIHDNEDTILHDTINASYTVDENDGEETYVTVTRGAFEA